MNKNPNSTNKATSRNRHLRLSQPLPPPPPEEEPEAPAPPSGFSLSDFHLPETNIFKGIRTQLENLEHAPTFKYDMEPILAVLIALVLGAFFGFVVSLAVNKAISAGLGDSKWLLPVFISPLFEESMKALCILAVAFALPRVFPNRRYSVLVGAATGLGFGVLATTVTLMTGEAQGFNAFARLIATPVTQPVFSAFMGIGIFVFLNKRSSSLESSFALGLPILFAVIAIVSHALANTIDIAAAGGIGAFVAAITVGPLFIFLLRDFLGGHLNIFSFLEPAEELPESPEVPPPIEETPP